MRNHFPQIINIDSPPTAAAPATPVPAPPGQAVPGQIITKDIFFVGYLLTRGLRIKDLVYDPHSRRGRVLFVVEGPQAQIHDEEYREEQAVANLADLKARIEFARDLMFDFLRTHDAAQQNTEQAACNIHRNMSRR